MSFQSVTLPDGVMKVSTIHEMYTLTPQFPSTYSFSEDIGKPLSFTGNEFFVFNKTINIPLQVKISAPVFVQSVPTTFTINPRTSGSFVIQLNLDGLNTLIDMGQLSSTGIIEFEVIPLDLSSPAFILT
jgi:hypothetical protein